MGAPAREIVRQPYIERIASPPDTAIRGVLNEKSLDIVSGLAAEARISKARSEAQKRAFIPLPVRSGLEKCNIFDQGGL